MARRTDPGLTTGGMLDHALDLCQGDLVAVMDARDVYGEHYLTDLSRAFLFATADIVGKAAYYAHLRDVAATVLRQPAAEYSYLPEVAGATLLARRTVLRGLGLRRRLRGLGRGADAPVPRGQDQGLLRRPVRLRLPPRSGRGCSARRSSSGTARPNRTRWRERRLAARPRPSHRDGTGAAAHRVRGLPCRSGDSPRAGAGSRWIAVVRRTLDVSFPG